MEHIDPSLNDTSLKRLEFDKILDLVGSYAQSDPGRELVLSLRPCKSREAAAKLRLETLHAADYIRFGVEPVVSNLQGIISAVSLLEQGAVYLEPAELRSTSEALRDMALFSEKATLDSQLAHGALCVLISALPALLTLSAKLRRITTPDGEIAPDASSELKHISGRIRSLRSSLASKLALIASRYTGTEVLRNQPPSVRSGRYVLPVAATHKKHVKGIIHDRSESGATLFIEPAEIVETGNELQEALMDLHQERRTILREATAALRKELGEINAGISVMKNLDFIFARARYHLNENTIFPDEGPLDLRELAHPLLPAESVVKSRVNLPSDWRVLVVSGPNAGGKSVLLKAVSLASACSRSGLGAHAEAGSTMPFFSKIMVSMGDNQSISMHMSTYSARLSEQKFMLDNGDSETLAVVDEPAAGTDPVTGAALAAVFLEKLALTGVRTIVSTHMGQLKLLANEHAGFYNGSMSFNPETLTPGFRFIAGIPGASCTFEAAAIAGFPDEMLRKSSELAGESFTLDSLIISLKEVEEAEKKELKRLTAERINAEKTGKKLEKLLRDRNAEWEKRIKDSDNEKEKLMKKIQSQADSLMVTLANSRSPEERKDVRRKMKNLASDLERTAGEAKSSGKSGEDLVLHSGDRVQVEGWSVPGVVEKTGTSTVMVRIGSLLLRKKRSSLAKLPPKTEAPNGASSYDFIEEKPEIILLGMTVEEAIAELDIKLDNCTAVSLKKLRVVHGKGRLMRGVTAWLKTDKRVGGVTIAPPGEGGVGASIVSLKG